MNVGPFSVDGSFATVNPAPYALFQPWEVTTGASQRFIIDLSDMSRSLRVLPTGISGNFVSAHYDDQVDLWLNLEYRPFVLSRDEVLKDKAHQLRLKPR